MAAENQAFSNNGRLFKTENTTSKIKARCCCCRSISSAPQLLISSCLVCRLSSLNALNSSSPSTLDSLPRHVQNASEGQLNQAIFCHGSSIVSHTHGINPSKFDDMRHIGCKVSRKSRNYNTFRYTIIHFSNTAIL